MFFQRVLGTAVIYKVSDKYDAENIMCNDDYFVRCSGVCLSEYINNTKSHGKENVCYVIDEIETSKLLKFSVTINFNKH